MSAILSIQVISDNSQRADDLEFFNTEEWTMENEILIMQKLHQLLNFLRPISTSFKLQLEVDVADVSFTRFQIQKEIKTGCVSNTQKLSLREIEVIGLIMHGYTNHEIAKKLFISYETVRSHRKHILSKTGAKNTAALINYYHQAFSGE